MTESGQGQAEVECEISVLGIPHWQDCLSNTLALSGGWERRLDRTTITELEFAIEFAKIHRLKPAWGIVMCLMNRGYTLEELEIEFDHGERRSWGHCVWYKEHPSYDQPVIEVSPLNIPNLHYAMFRTEHAGDQRSSFFSGSMLASADIIPNKAFVFCKVVLAPPLLEVEEAAAA